VEDVAVLVEQQRPDLLLMQEATAPLDALPALIGGYFHRLPLPARIHGLATWSPHELTPPSTLALPESRMPGRMPPRLAQVVRIGGITLANVHLSHGQILNRQQLACIVRSIDGAAAVIGDYNAVGPVLLPGFRDVGPRAPTHVVRNVLPFRLDRCLVRGVLCANACVLERGSSDHRPIMIELAAAQQSVPTPAAWERRVGGRLRAESHGLHWRGFGTDLVQVLAFAWGFEEPLGSFRLV
jgi:endonuclease/exonuclease/phosphatase family metal-dependent hydrolase